MNAAVYAWLARVNGNAIRCKTPSLRTPVATMAATIALALVYWGHGLVPRAVQARGHALAHRRGSRGGIRGLG